MPPLLPGALQLEFSRRTLNFCRLLLLAVGESVATVMVASSIASFIASSNGDLCLTASIPNAVSTRVACNVIPNLTLQTAFGYNPSTFQPWPSFLFAGCERVGTDAAFDSFST